MKKFITIIAVICTFGVPAMSGTLTGLFKTEPSEEGNYLKVKFEPCSANKNLTCGKIKTAIKANGSTNKNYEHLGKNLVWDMVDNGDGTYKDGKIWDPSANNDDGSKKIYNSKMKVSGDMVRVDGCILFFCKGQDWKKVN
jgi:hypothetical protein